MASDRKAWDIVEGEGVGEMKRQQMYQMSTGLFNHSEAGKALVVNPARIVIGKVVNVVRNKSIGGVGEEAVDDVDDLDDVEDSKL